VSAHQRRTAGPWTRAWLAVLRPALTPVRHLNQTCIPANGVQNDIWRQVQANGQTDGAGFPSS
jgi:hypothetical protein